MLLKIPFIIFQSVCFYISFTPPNSAPPPEERTGRLYCFESYINILITTGWFNFTIIVFCMAGPAEIAVLLANKFPSLPGSSFILQNLLFPYDLAVPSSMRLTLPALVGSILVTAGGLLRLWCYRSLGDLFTFHLSIQENHRLVTTGPYAYVRHPSYSGAVLAVLGGLLVLFGRGGWVRESGFLGTPMGKAVAVMWVALMCFLVPILIERPLAEDKGLRDVFGKEWDEWAERVPWWFIPEVY